MLEELQALRQEVAAMRQDMRRLPPPEPPTSAPERAETPTPPDDTRSELRAPTRKADTPAGLGPALFKLDGLRGLLAWGNVSM